VGRSEFWVILVYEAYGEEDTGYGGGDLEDREDGEEF